MDEKVHNLCLSSQILVINAGDLDGLARYMQQICVYFVSQDLLYPSTPSNKLLAVGFELQFDPTTKIWIDWLDGC